MSPWEGVLKHIPEVFIYNLVIGDLELDALLKGGLIHSPFSSERTASFGLFIHPTTGRLKFTDFGRNIKGDAVDFIRAYYDLDYRTALEYIKTCFELGLDMGENLISSTKEIQIDSSVTVIDTNKINFTDAGLKYWNTWGLGDSEFLKNNGVYQINKLWINSKPVYVKDIAFEYPILHKKKILQPYNKKYKWLNNYTSNMAENYIETINETGELAIITKAKKECLYYKKHLNLTAVCAKSETTILSNKVIESLKSRFKRVVVALDNDATGKLASVAYSDMGFETMFFPYKNITDMHEAVGLNESLFYFNKIIKTP